MVPSGAFFQSLARTGEPRRLSGALSLALPGLLSARLIPGLGKQLLPWQVTLPQLRAHSKPDSATQPAKACQETGGPLSILSQETLWKEGYSCSCWENSGTPGAVLGLGYPRPLPSALSAAGSVHFGLIKGSSVPVRFFSTSTLISNIGHFVCLLS